MLTMNAVRRPLMRRMHKPDPEFGPDEQDKRSVVAIELDDIDAVVGLHKRLAVAMTVATQLQACCRSRRIAAFVPPYKACCAGR